MNQTPTTEEVQLIHSPHSSSRYTRGWRSIAIWMVLAAFGTLNRNVFWLVIFLPIVVWTIRSERMGRKQRNALSPIEHWSRLRCYGNHDELETLKNIEPQFFEPHILQTSSFVQPGGLLQATAPWNFISIFAVVALYVVLNQLKFQDVWIFGFFCLLYLVFYFATYHVTPLYYRITPGILEVLKSPIATSDLKLRRKLDLANAKITCYCGHEAVIQIPDEPPERILFGYFSNEEEKEFVQKLFAAAVSPHTSPNLPTNTLTN